MINSLGSDQNYMSSLKQENILLSEKGNTMAKQIEKLENVEVS